MSFKKGHLAFKGTEATQFKKGQVPWNKDKKIMKACLKCGKEFRTFPSYISRGKYCSQACRKINKTCIDCGVKIHNVATRCRVCANKGKLSPFYIHGRASLNWTEREIIKATAKYKHWRQAVFERDNYTCQICKTRGNILQADHIKSFSRYPSLRFNTENGRTLCVECHKKTPNYGYKAVLEDGGGAHEFQSAT